MFHALRFMLGTGGFINPESIIGNLNIQAGFKVADFGAGSGYFTILIARAVGPDGLVAAIDVLEDKLATIKSSAQSQGLSNISYIRGNLEVLGNSQLTDASQDMVILANILFQSQKKDSIVKESHRVLKPGGELAVIDWEPSSVFGTKEPGWKISKEDASTMITGLGFSFERDIVVSSNHWGMLFRKN